MTHETVADGRSTRWDEHRATRRAALLALARKAVHKHGPEASMDEIAAQCGTSKSIVYRYFDDKTGLQRAVGEDVGVQMHHALSSAADEAGTPKRALRAMVRVYLEMVDQSPNVYWFVARTGAVAGTDGAGAGARVPLDAFLDSVTELVARPFAQVAHVTDVVASSWAAGAVGFVRGSGEWWLKHRTDPGAPTLDELTGQVADWLWFGPVGVLSQHAAPNPTAAAPSDTPDPAAPEENR
ncbi:TetR family transcriptional regulator [Paraoerskovia sediminicola]|uniref:TetR family transcriptional regulator n=1 Tax=Paraoerskovia sediminicola TaxID=1138587 RepID=A0ABM8G0Y0_9CELL|nr:TetR/AcrR family transcriptional regulator [Paraoerskovia sediminicola]BDZ41570.1 TetR family transcriptional regulator [Paraoerskovia sediminicola]